MTRFSLGRILCSAVLMIVFGCTVIIQEAIAIRIKDLRVPNMTHFGKPALLDCVYVLEEDDADLVVKWFFNGTLVYQWIPSFRPIDVGLFRGRVNLNYWASNDTNSIHRALYIQNPDPTMSGEYTCSVSTMVSEDVQKRRMLVFVPEKKLELYQRRTASNIIQVLCSAERVFPRPSLNLFVDNSEVKDSKVAVRNWDNYYDVNVSANVSTTEKPEKISCQLSVAEANYTSRKEAVYYPTSKGVRTFIPWTTSLAVQYCWIQLVYFVQDFKDTAFVTY